MPVNRKALSLSPSAISAYEWCPAQFLGTYILKVPGTEFVPTPDTAIGKAVHRAMKKLNERRRDDSTTAGTELETWARDYWAEEKASIPGHKAMSEADSQAYENWAVAHTVAIAKLTRGQVPAIIEEYGSMPLMDGWYIGGQQDAVLPDGTVIDYKTLTDRALTGRDREKYRLQAAIYAAIIRHERGILPEVHLIFSDNATCEDWTVPLTATSVDDALDHARRIATEIDRMLETGTPFPRGRSCRWCPLAGNCPQTISPLAAA